MACRGAGHRCCSVSPFAIRAMPENSQGVGWRFSPRSELNLGGPWSLVLGTAAGPSSTAGKSNCWSCCLAEGLAGRRCVGRTDVTKPGWSSALGAAVCPRSAAWSCCLSQRAGWPCERQTVKCKNGPDSRLRRARRLARARRLGRVAVAKGPAGLVIRRANRTGDWLKRRLREARRHKLH